MVVVARDGIEPPTPAFVLLCVLHALLFAAALRLPLSIDKTTELSSAEKSSMILEMAE
jgi:hypothetical protein